ncbi:hypothetical protein DCCM_0679 [Desulfocucumis palustris]|uniref:Uncharacterized protein n=1 Tax=Desulfocucumis palustris TaxID=1898651 RepID=A0A2L2XA34_9FIRM|nr:hypothetical protein DCCM_0679 [Desulfocucumis palustris]
MTIMLEVSAKALENLLEFMDKDKPLPVRIKEVMSGCG